MNTQQTEALRLADAVRTHDDHPRVHFYNRVAAELLRLHAEYEQHLQELRSYRITVENREARIVELERQLAAVQQGVQPVAWLAEYVDREGNSKWYVSTHKDLAAENDIHGAPKPLYTHPATHGVDAIRQEIEALTPLLPKNTDCSGLWAALDAAHAKQGGVSNG